MDSATTRYTRVGSAHVAYQVVGQGEPLLLMLGLSTHVEAMWEEASLARYLMRLASFSTLIAFDKRGAGLSDALGDAATLETHVDDAVAVLDELGLDQVTVVAANEASLIALPLAATFPHRVRQLAIINGTAKFMWSEDYPIGIEWDVGRDFVKEETDSYSDRPSSIPLTAPSKVGDPAFEAWAKRFQRLASSPGSYERTARLVGSTDVRPALPIIRCPVLILHRRGDRFTPIDHGKYLADHLSDARFVELEGRDHLPWVGPDTGRMLEEIERFVTGTESAVAADRVLATIVFTDIVGSTEQLAAVGDREWTALVEAHNDAIASIARSRGGRVVDTAGDGAFAVFDGPSRGIEAAVAIRVRLTHLGLTVRAGVHTGEVELLGDAVRGVAVHTAARVMANAANGGVVVSRTVRDLVSGSRFRFGALGPHALKGLPDPVELFEVLDSDPPDG